MPLFCFCTKKGSMTYDVIEPSNKPLQLLHLERSLKKIDPDTHEVIYERLFEENIVTTTKTTCCGDPVVIACTTNKIYILDNTLQEIYNFSIIDEILSCANESLKSQFYIGCKSGRIIVYTLKRLGKVIVNEIFTFNCFQPVYNIAVQIERSGEIVKRQVFAGFSRWNNTPLKKISIYNNSV